MNGFIMGGIIWRYENNQILDWFYEWKNADDWEDFVSE